MVILRDFPNIIVHCLGLQYNGPWNIPKRPPSKSLCLGIPESFEGGLGDASGMLQGYVGFFLEIGISLAFFVPNSLQGKKCDVHF